MNKQTFVEILECALLNFEGVQEAELVQTHGLNPELAKIGCQLCSYLKSKELIQNEPTL
jgi:hypothetical protein